MTTLRKFLARDAADRRVAVEAAALLLLAWCGLRVLPFARLVGTVGGAGAKGPALSREKVLQIRWAVEAAARTMPLPLTCLPQALAACWMLRARGAAPRMHYGVASRGDGNFEAHAWVELDGAPVIGHRNAHEFTLLTTFPHQEPAAP